MSLDAQSSPNQPSMTLAPQNRSASAEAASPEHLQAEIKRLELSLNDTSALREQLESILRQRDDEFRAQTSRLVDLQQQRDAAISQLRQQEARFASVESKLTEASKGRESEDRRVEALVAETEGLRAELEAARRSADERRQSLEAELAKLKTTLIAVQNEYARLRDDVAPSMAKAARHDQLMQILPPWLEKLLVRFAGGKRA